MKKIYISLFFVCQCLCFCQAQTALQLDSIAKAYYNVNDFANALPYAEKALKMYSQQDSTRMLLAENLGAVYFYLGQYAECEKLMLEAQSLCAKLYGKSHRLYAKALDNLANVYLDQGVFDKAERSFLEAKLVYEKANFTQHVDYGNLLNNLAVFYYKMENFEQSELMYLDAKALFLKLEGNEGINYTDLVSNLAALYARIGEPKKAEPLYLEALALREKIWGKDNPDYALSLHNLAVFYTMQKKDEQAKPLLDKALSVWAKTYGKAHFQYSMGLSAMGRYYAHNKNYEQATQNYLEALQIRRPIYPAKHPQIVYALAALTGLFLETKNYEKALDYTLQGFIANAQELDSSQVLSDDLIARLPTLHYVSKDGALASMQMLSSIYFAQYEENQDVKLLEKSYLLVEKAVAFAERIRNEFSSERSKLRTVTEILSFVYGGIKKAKTISNEIPEKSDKYLASAFSLAEQNKSVLIADALKSRQAYNFGFLPDSLAAQEKELHKKSDELKKKIIEKKNAEEKQAAQSKLSELNLEIEAFTKKLASDFPKYYEWKYAAKSTQLGEIQALLDDKTILLEYMVGDNFVYVFKLKNNKLELFEVPMPRSELEQQVATLRKCLSDYTFIQNQSEQCFSDYTQTAHWFFEKLLASALQGETAINKLVIVPDAMLGHLPFEVFLDKKPESQNNSYRELSYLINRYSVSYAYSAALFYENNGSQPKANGKILAMAGYYPAQLDSSLLRHRLPYQIHKRSQFLELPFSEKEVQGLAEYLQGDFKFKEAANERFFKENADKYSILHLSMHGSLDARSPLLSSLVFSEDGDSAENNFLQAYEISQMELNADLVVLSACETGYGKFQQGEGVMSLARSFMYAGAPALLVSMWEVNDASTSAIMQSFYKNIAAGQGKAEALQQAKIEYLSNAKGLSAHPAFWSPFVQIGNNKPIVLAQKSGKGWLWGIGGVALLLVILVVAKRKRAA